MSQKLTQHIVNSINIIVKELVNVMELAQVINVRNICGTEFNVYGTADAPLFKARDVANWLGYKKTGHGSPRADYMVSKLNDNQKVKLMLPTSNGVKATWFVTEDGLYKLIMRSDLPQTEVFNDWVCEDVLPCIRKHGFYSKEQVRLDKILKMANIVENENYMINGGF